MQNEQMMMYVSRLKTVGGNVAETAKAWALRYWKDAVNVLLVFCYVFSFKIVSIVDSAMLVGLGLAVYFVVNAPMRKRVLSLILSKSVLWIFLSVVALTVWIQIILWINGTSDYSLVPTLIHLVAKLGVGLFLYAFLKEKGYEKRIVNYILVAFVLQALIALLGVVSPLFRELIYLTKDEYTIKKSKEYGFIRGLSLAASSFFGLSVPFGCTLILFFSKRNTLTNDRPVLGTFVYLLLMIGTFFAGRMGLLGAILGLVYVLVFCRKTIQKANVLKILSTIGKILLVALAVIGLISLAAPNNELLKIARRMFKFVTEFFTVTDRTGLFETTSTNTLLNMYFPIPWKTFFLGDGLYTNAATGGYYMGTDAGYMRPILYLGIFGLLLMGVLQHFILNVRKPEKPLYYFLWVYLLIVQVKGDVLGYAIMTQSLLLLFALQSNEEEEPILLKE